MSQTPACPDVPDEVRKLALGVVVSFLDRPGGQGRSQAHDLRDIVAAAIMEDRASRALPSTALAARPEEGWQIKPLEWTYDSARTPFGTYVVSVQGPVIRAIFENMQHCLVASSDPEAAKAAAQADYETRIRSALVAPPTPPTAGDGQDSTTTTGEEA